MKLTYRSRRIPFHSLSYIMFILILFLFLILPNCRDPSPWWHVARIAIRSNSIRTPQEDLWRAPLSGLPQGEAHDTREHHTRTLAYPIRICCSDHWLKWASLATSFRQPATAHIRRLQSERTGAMASRLPRSLIAVRRVMMALPPPRGIMTSQKVFSPLKRESELLTLYKRVFTQGGR